MSVSRRSFLIGAGSIITAAFVREAVSFIGDTRGQPFLLQPPAPSQTLFYEQVEDYWYLHLGEPQFEAPEPPLWIDHLRSLGVKLETQRQIDRYCEREGFDEDDLHTPIDGYSWEDYWEHEESPAA